MLKVLCRHRGSFISSLSPPSWFSHLLRAPTMNASYCAASAAERCAIVDLNNEVVGSALRQRLRDENLLHRATYIYVHNSKFVDKLCIHVIVTISEVSYLCLL